MALATEIPVQPSAQHWGLVRGLVVATMICLGLILVLSFQLTGFKGSAGAIAIPVLAIASLLACLFVAVKARRFHQSQLAMAKQVNELGEEVAQKDEELQELNRLHKAVSRVNCIDSHDQIYKTVLAAGLDLVGADCGSIMLIDRSEDELYFVALEGLDEGLLGQRQPLCAAVAGWVVKNNQPTLIEGDAEEDDRFDSRVRRRTKMHQGMCVPLNALGSVRGVLNLGSSLKNDKACFESDDIELVKLFAQHAALAVENARMHGLLFAPSASELEDEPEQEDEQAVERESEAQPVGT